MIFSKTAGGLKALVLLATLAFLLAPANHLPVRAQENPAEENGVREENPGSAEISGEVIQTEVQSGISFTYNPTGRRDPFKSLLEKSPDSSGLRPEGLPGIQITEVDVLGIVKRQDGTYMAVIRGTDKETFTIHVGDILYDGTVANILPSQVVFSQRIDDPTIARNFREVSIPLNPYEEANR